MHNTRIKVCGITRRSDAESAAAAGADALGFVFYSGSSRYVEPEAAAAISLALPPFLAKVGLFVNASREEILQTVARGFLSCVQLHGDESPDFCRQLRADLGGVALIKAVRVAVREDLRGVSAWPVQAILLDAKVDNRYGGTGQTFDWSVLNGWSDLFPGRERALPLILAGGLTPENVGAAVAQVRPYAVDVSSGVEQSPGIKCTHTVTRFAQQVRQADRERPDGPGWKGDGDDQARQ